VTGHGLTHLIFFVSFFLVHPSRQRLSFGVGEEGRGGGGGTAATETETKMVVEPGVVRAVPPSDEVRVWANSSAAVDDVGGGGR
jgi:hypothetical protein